MSAAVAAPEALNESELPPEILAEALPLKTLLPDGTPLGATGEQLPSARPKAMGPWIRVQHDHRS